MILCFDKILSDDDVRKSMTELLSFMNSDFELSEGLKAKNYNHVNCPTCGGQGTMKFVKNIAGLNVENTTSFTRVVVCYHCGGKGHLKELSASK